MTALHVHCLLSPVSLYFLVARMLEGGEGNK